MYRGLWSKIRDEFVQAIREASAKDPKKALESLKRQVSQANDLARNWHPILESGYPDGLLDFSELAGDLEGWYQEARSEHLASEPKSSDKAIMLDLTDLTGEDKPVSLFDFITDNQDPDASPLAVDDIVSLRRLRPGQATSLGIGGGGVDIRRVS